ASACDRISVPSRIFPRVRVLVPLRFLHVGSLSRLSDHVAQTIARSPTRRFLAPKSYSTRGAFPIENGCWNADHAATVNSGVQESTLMGKIHRKDDNPANRDPITGAPGSHPAGTAAGAAAGGVAGAAIGSA